MKNVDATIKVVAVGALLMPAEAPAGSDFQVMPSGWNEEVLTTAGHLIDGLSVHWYFPSFLGRAIRDDESDTLQVMAGTDGLAAGLDATIASIKKTMGPSGRRVPIALDEWNRMSFWNDLLEANHRLCDSVFVAGCYNRILERADAIELAMVSHIVNCLAPIQTVADRHFVTSEYLVGLLYRWLGRARAVHVDKSSEEVLIPPFADRRDIGTLVPPVGAVERAVPSIDATATVDDSGATVFLANRRLDREITVEVTGLPVGASGRFRHLVGEGPFARNTVDRPNALAFRDVDAEVNSHGSCEVVVPPHTAGALTLSVG
jgi:alpha-N-arabinofuranosidase